MNGVSTFPGEQNRSGLFRPLPEKKTTNFQVLDDGNYKLSAAQILEASGLKGAMIGNVGMSSKHSLVLICNGLYDASNVKNFEDLAKKTVHDNFGVILEREPIYL